MEIKTGWRDSTLEHRTADFLGRNKIKVGAGCVGCVLLIIIIALIAIPAKKVEPVLPAATDTVTAIMTARFAVEPDYNKYGKSGDSFNTQWSNQLYGGSVLNAVYSCKERTNACHKPNALTTEMKNVEVQIEWHGYFKFENLANEEAYIDVEFFMTDGT